MSYMSIFLFAIVVVFSVILVRGEILNPSNSGVLQCKIAAIILVALVALLKSTNVIQLPF